MREVAVKFSKMPTIDLSLFARTLVDMDPAQAERLKNFIGFSQQERDLADLDQEKQYEMMSREADNE